MTIIPPKEIQYYISTDENGEWIHDPAMPAELLEAFHKFVEKEKEARKAVRDAWSVRR